MHITEHDTTTGTTKVTPMLGGCIGVYREGCESRVVYDPRLGQVHYQGPAWGQGTRGPSQAAQDTAKDLILSHLYQVRPREWRGAFDALRPRPPSENQSRAAVTWAPYTVSLGDGTTIVGLGNTGCHLTDRGPVPHPRTLYDNKPTADHYTQQGINLVPAGGLGTPAAAPVQACPECGGTGVYVGLTVTEPCSTCRA